MTRETLESNPSSAPNRGRFPRIVAGLLWIVFLGALLLGLVIPLKHVGFVVFCFIAGMAAGWLSHRRRLSVASLTAFLVFTLTYLACWLPMGSTAGMARGALLYTQSDFQRISKALSRYAASTGDFPGSLRELAALEDHDLDFEPSGQVLDHWEHPFHYQKTAAGFELASLGRDGQRGGSGLDADVFIGDTMSRWHDLLPLSQFLFETRASGALFKVALVASLAAGGIWYCVERNRRFPLKQLIASIAVTTISAAIVAGFLAAIHVMLSQSGH